MNRVAANLPARLSSSSEEITMEPDGLQTFIDDVGLVVSSTDDEYEITKRVAERLSDLLAGGYRLPPEVTRPSPVHHVTYPLYVAPDDSWSMASVVWDVGQRTPVHGHETWGVVGIYSGVEREVRYLKPVASTAGAALTPAGEELWEPGQVSVCCTPTTMFMPSQPWVTNPPSGSTSTASLVSKITSPSRREHDSADGQRLRPRLTTRFGGGCPPSASARARRPRE
jgi:3-mercaptopropionate dioxygenase